MKTVAFLLSALAASTSAFAPSSFNGNAMKTGVTSDSALSMALERSYIMVRYLWYGGSFLGFCFRVFGCICFRVLCLLISKCWY